MASLPKLITCDAPCGVVYFRLQMFSRTARHYGIRPLDLAVATNFLIVNLSGELVQF
jgi:hypothetical protein